MKKTELLEKKIKETINYIENLKLEKETYQKELIGLKIECKTKENEIKALKMKYSQASSNFDDNEKIKIKLKDLLRKIDDFELLNL